MRGPTLHGAFIAGCAAVLLLGCEERCRDPGTQLTVLNLALDAEPNTSVQFVDPPSENEFPGAGTLQVERIDDSSFRVIGRGARGVEFTWSGIREDGTFLVGDGAAIQFSLGGEPASRGSFAIGFSSFEPPRFESTFDVVIERAGGEVPATGGLSLFDASFEGGCV